MRRLLQVRLLFVLIALLLVPALALPFAGRLRTKWASYWEPTPIDEAAELSELLARVEEEFQLRMRVRRGDLVIPSSSGSDAFAEPIEYPTPVLTIVGCRFAGDEQEARVWRALEAVDQLEQARGPFDEINVVVPDDSPGATSIELGDSGWAGR